MQVALPADPTHCPQCGQPNECALVEEHAEGVLRFPCWCDQAKFEASLLSRIPEQARGKAGLCHACTASESN